MRLESINNAAAIALYRSAGCTSSSAFTRLRGYSDGCVCECLVPLHPDVSGVPHYRQALEFTCGRRC
jgi:hypothetical protein